MTPHDRVLGVIWWRSRCAGFFVRGCPSIATEKPLRVQLLSMLYAIRSNLLLMEEMANEDIRVHLTMGGLARRRTTARVLLKLLCTEISKSVKVGLARLRILNAMHAQALLEATQAVFTHNRQGLRLLVSPSGVVETACLQAEVRYSVAFSHVTLPTGQHTRKSMQCLCHVPEGGAHREVAVRVCDLLSKMPIEHELEIVSGKAAREPCSLVCFLSSESAGRRILELLDCLLRHFPALSVLPLSCLSPSSI